MVNIISTIWNFIKGIDIRLLLGLGLFLVAGFAYHQYEQKQEYQKEVQKQENNIQALQDSTRQYRTRSGVLGAEKLALQMSVNNLKETNEELAEEIEEERGNVEVITKTETIVESDTVEANADLTTLGSHKFKIDWEFQNSGDQWNRYLSGYISFRFDTTRFKPIDITSKLENDRLNLSITAGLRNKGGKKSMFIRSSYPNIKFTNVQAAVIEDNIVSNQAPKRWGVGISAGYGFNGERFAPTIAATVNYNFIRW